MSKTETRGTEKLNSKTKFKDKKKKKAIKNDVNGNVETLQDLKTKEDETLLMNVEDGEQSDLDFGDDSHSESSIVPSEISGFLKELGISKYRPKYGEPILVEDNITSETSNSKKKKAPVKNGEDVEIKEEPVDNKKKKKKKKSVAENTEIKEEPDKNGQTEKEKMKNGKLKKKQTEKKQAIAEKPLPTEFKEEKPDLKALKAAMSYMKLEKSNRSILLLKSGELWREDKAYVASKIGPEDKLVQEALVVAERVLKEDIVQYAKEKEKAKRSETRWLKTVLVSGTLSDKIAALTLLIQESPVHNIASIDSLLSMASKKGRREALMAMDTLKDLFLTGLLPDDRKLKYFYQFPLYKLYEMTSGNLDQRDRLLLCWYFEDLMKKKYSQLIKILGEMSFDTLQATKERAVKIIHELLSSKPEHEHVLLPMLVNKMGDHNLNNKASYLMVKLVEQHPNMKGTIVKEVCQLLYRPNISERAQYISICFLTQLRLSPDENKLATELIKIYLSFFQANLKKRVVDTKTMSALLTGVNRAYVYASKGISEILGEMNEIYKILPTVNFQTGVQALMLLLHISENDTKGSARFYSALYRKLNDPGLATTTKHAIFLNLLFKSLKRDSMDNRVIAFIKRILQVYSHHPPHIICGVLILLSQIMNAKPTLLNLSSKGQVSWEEPGDAGQNDDEEERYVDLPIPAEFANGEAESSEPVANGEKSDTDAEVKEETTTSSLKSSWVHRINKEGQQERTTYDPNHRNPLYSRAELECIWELEKLANHFHPTVSLYANMLLKCQCIEYNGDPIADYTLIRFLDRFVYKNPKKMTNQTSVGAPKQKEATGIRKIPVNSQEYLKQKSVPEDELFYFKYFTEKERLKKGKEDDDNDSVGDDEFDKYMEKFMDGKEEDFGDLDLDFAGETSRSKTKLKGMAAGSDSEEDEDDEEDDMDLDLDDDEMAAEFERELQGLGATNDDGFNEDDVDFSSDENDPLGAMMVKPEAKGKRKKSELFQVAGRTEKKKRKLDSADLFASAEEFSHLLEEGIDSGTVSLGGANQMRNEDKAAQKQIAWEEKRDKWINNKGRPTRTGKKGKGKPFKKGGGMKPKQGLKSSKKGK